VATHWFLGIWPQVDGLCVDPSIPAEWSGFNVTRKFRNAWYHIEVKNPENVAKGVKSLVVDGKSMAGTLIPIFDDEQEHRVEVVLG
jgi:cellobiose phosphorylase